MIAAMRAGLQDALRKALLPREREAFDRLLRAYEQLRKDYAQASAEWARKLETAQEDHKKSVAIERADRDRWARKCDELRAEHREAMAIELAKLQHTQADREQAIAERDYSDGELDAHMTQFAEIGVEAGEAMKRRDALRKENTELRDALHKADAVSMQRQQWLDDVAFELLGPSLAAYDPSVLPQLIRENKHALRRARRQLAAATGALHDRGEHCPSVPDSERTPAERCTDEAES